jgi:hypothetical protein
MKTQEAIDYIMDSFDFENVHTTMKALDWEWASAEDKIPSVFELKQKARELIKSAMQSKGKAIISSGGFTVMFDNTTRERHLQMTFNVEERGVVFEDDKIEAV